MQNPVKSKPAKLKRRVRDGAQAPPGPREPRADGPGRGGERTTYIHP